MIKTIIGIILKNSWLPINDERISLYTLDSEEEYLIEKNDTEISLKNVLGTTVVVDGETFYDDSLTELNRKKISVKKYSIQKTKKQEGG